MRTHMHHHQETTLDKFIKYVAIMAVGYILCGLFLMTAAHEALVISKLHAMAMSLIVTGYGFYRSIKVYEKYYKPK